MKRLMAMLLGGVIALMVFAAGGNPVQAADVSSSSSQPVTTKSDCGCNVTILTGAERNKIVSNLLKSESFKQVKKEYKKQGYTWNGAHDIQVVRNNDNHAILVGVPFTDPKGNKVIFVFYENQLAYISPEDN
ncbi:hypothetical protein HPT25_19890 [Bacillus sp. BRMEA1]|uniref:hypothetical protein n=1 Tax=Neobacillus endophyticus TaxID=2738405 RepID=UPI00156513AC|nr:hypothetical protein [Neobacillus endophyticus]NRD79627.1 hypothetical protein [Neobacillus endophyticus]